MPFNPLATTYRRVIPRDLFNEADLLKCYGRLWVCLDNLPRSGHTARLGDADGDHDGAPFRIGQDQASGALTVANVPFTIGGRPYRLMRPLNSRLPWPLSSSVTEGRSGDSFTLIQNGDRISFMDLRAASALLKALHSQTEGGDDDGK